MTSAVRAILFGVMCVGNVVPAMATTCSPVTPASHIANAGVIFEGVAAQAVPSPKPSSLAPVRVSFKVVRAVKGIAGSRTVLSYVNDGGAVSGWRFTSAPQLIFARRTGRGTLELDYCGMVMYHLRQDQREAYGMALRGLSKR